MTTPKNATAYQGARSYSYRGRKVPSVTTLLQAFPMPWLGGWAAKMVAEEAVMYPERWRELGTDDALRHLKGSPWRKRDTAADFGTAIHTALAALVRNEPMVTVPGAEGHIAALVAWWETYRPHVLDSEIQVINLTDGYAGSLDAIAEVYGRRILLDLKTSSQVGAKERLQLAAYRYAESIFADDKIIASVPIVDACAILHIPRDYPDQWQFFEVPAGAAEFAVFQQVAAVYHYHKANDQQPVGEIILPQEVLSA